MSDTAITMSPIIVPEDADAPDAVDFCTGVDIRNRVHAKVHEDQAMMVTPAQALPAWREQTDEEICGFLVRIDGEPAGRAMLYVARAEGSRSADVQVDILPEHWGHGAGRVAIAQLEDLARARDRKTLHGWTDHRQLDGERLPARTGHGDLPVDHVSRTLAAAGYVLEQVYRASALDVTTLTDRIHELLGTARAAASGYRYLSWTIPTPPERREGYARMKARMITDAPAGDLDLDEETWDCDRIERMDARRIAQGFTGLVGAIEHIESGDLVAYNELYHLGERSRATQQNDTLVLKEHRGRRLGMLVKCESLLLWRELMPESRTVLTNNAEENRPMLDINEALGFQPISYAGVWQKELR